jgi:hypothetical protein
VVLLADRRPDLEPPVVDRERDEPGLERAVADGVGHLDRVLADHADADIRVAAAEVLDEPAEQVVVRAPERPEAHRAAGQGAHLLDRLDRLLRRRERALGMRPQHPAGLGQDQPPAGAREEGDAELRLQLADLVREARLGHHQRLGRCRERALVRRSEEVPELLERHRLCLLML